MAEYYLTRSKKNRELGNCACGRVIDANLNGSYCRKCSVTMKKHQAKRNEEKAALRKQWATDRKCRECGEDRAGDKAAFCTRHYLERLAMNWLGSMTKANILQDIFDNQYGNCWYTGAPLRLGDVGTEADHKLPRWSHPHLASDPANIVFCETRINRMKGRMTAEEFIAVCQAVARQHPPES